MDVGTSSSVFNARTTVEQLLREKRSAEFAEGDVALADTEFGCPYCHDAETYDIGSLIEHVEDEHGYSNRVVVCPACRRTTRNLVQHLLHHTQLLSGYASCASSASQPSTSRATCHSLEWGRQACCSEFSYCTTTAAEEESAGAQDTLSQLDAHSIISGSDVTELISLTDSMALGGASSIHTAAGVSPPASIAGSVSKNARGVDAGEVVAASASVGGEVAALSTSKVEEAQVYRVQAPPPPRCVYMGCGDDGVLVSNGAYTCALAGPLHRRTVQELRSMYVHHLLVSALDLAPPP